ncbi:type II toxin-antitoxin system VapC family toxin [Cellulomonas sp. ATA003]|uniref:type II toxin-antitoxin system VapC family toxin n=1 Tax=Cellulomonas sp. ATA003 TaxID=3073064 RepID=UPI002873E294|nr:type II toxin-antitoxin system VapC family toxin [Cellulomonas sp. ATA003]WNB84428.1 type II toxin-antitoxin system VapC family toxin [Cellulomonas sp. ATA003]
MTKFVVDASAVLHLAAEGITVGAEHELLAPTFLRSQVMSNLHEAVQRGELSDEVARERLAQANKIKVRMLGDAPMRRRAWEVADRLGWWETLGAEYVALTELQGDALVTLDGDFARALDGVVTLASVDDLR